MIRNLLHLGKHCYIAEMSKKWVWKIQTRLFAPLMEKFKLVVLEENDCENWMCILITFLAFLAGNEAGEKNNRIKSSVPRSGKTFPKTKEILPSLLKWNLHVAPFWNKANFSKTIQKRSFLFFLGKPIKNSIQEKHNVWYNGALVLLQCQCGRIFSPPFWDKGLKIHNTFRWPENCDLEVCFIMNILKTFWTENKT